MNAPLIEQLLKNLEAKGTPDHGPEVQAQSFPLPVKAGDWMDFTYPPTPAIIEHALDAGDKFSIIGVSKGKKTWFGLQLCLCLASGRRFLQWDIPKPRKVLLVNFEIREARMHERIRKIATGCGFVKESLNRLTVINARGRARDILPMQNTRDSVHVAWNPTFVELVKAKGYEVILFDPWYKIAGGDENRAEDAKPVLAQFDLLAEETGAAVGYVHHCPKGTPGDRASIDRAAGSGVLARDFDTSFNLDNHATEGLNIVEGTFRNHKPAERHTIRWNEVTGFFDLDPTPAEIRTSGTRARTSKVVIDPEEAKAVAMKLISGGPVLASDFNAGLETALGVGRNKAYQVRQDLVQSKILGTRKKDGHWQVGTHEQLKATCQLPGS